jgi:hypothetical protein
MAAWLAPTRGDKYGVVAHVGSGELEHDVEHLADGRSATWSARRVSVGWRLGAVRGGRERML